MSKKKEDKESRGRPINGKTKKSISICVRAEPMMRDYIFKKFSGWQGFFDHHAYQLVPKNLRPKQKKEE